MRQSVIFSGIKTDEYIEEGATKTGVVLKTSILLLLAIVSGLLFIYLFSKLDFNTIIIALVACGIGAVIFGMIGQLVPKAATVCSILYSICEGSILGLLSFALESAIGGIVLSAILITALIFAITLLLYATGIVKVNRPFLSFFMVITIVFVVSTLVYFLLALISPNNIIVQAIMANPVVMILVDLFSIFYGSLMLFMDFRNVDMLVSNGFDKRYEWNAALGLMISIIWIYFRVLRILAFVMNRRS